MFPSIPDTYHLPGRYHHLTEHRLVRRQNRALGRRQRARLQRCPGARHIGWPHQREPIRTVRNRTDVVVHGQIDEKALLTIDRVLQIEERIVCGALADRIRRVATVEVVRSGEQTGGLVVGEIAAPRGENRGLDGDLGGCAEHRRHGVLQHERPANGLHVDVAVGEQIVDDALEDWSERLLVNLSA